MSLRVTPAFKQRCSIFNATPPQQEKKKPQKQFGRKEESGCCDVESAGGDEGSDALAFVRVTFTAETLISSRATRDPFNLSGKDIVTYSLSD